MLCFPVPALSIFVPVHSVHNSKGDYEGDGFFRVNCQMQVFEDLLLNKYGRSRKVIMVDENTHDHCLEYLLTSFPSLV
jgi:hypothetical protein